MLERPHSFSPKDNSQYLHSGSSSLVETPVFFIDSFSNLRIDTSRSTSCSTSPEPSPQFEPELQIFAQQFNDVRAKRIQMTRLQAVSGRALLGDIKDEKREKRRPSKGTSQGRVGKRYEKKV